MGTGAPTTGDGLLNKSFLDIPMGEFWTPPPGMRDGPDHAADLLEAASAAHIYGKKIAAAESFTTAPNAPVWASLRDNFGPGDKLVDTQVGLPSVYAQGFATRDGKHKILLINKRSRPVIVSVPSGAGAQVDFVDQTTGTKPPGSVKLPQEQLGLDGFAVAVVSLPK